MCIWRVAEASLNEGRFAETRFGLDISKSWDPRRSEVDFRTVTVITRLMFCLLYNIIVLGGLACHTPSVHCVPVCQTWFDHVLSSIVPWLWRVLFFLFDLAPFVWLHVIVWLFTYFCVTQCGSNYNLAASAFFSWLYDVHDTVSAQSSKVL